MDRGRDAFIRLLSGWMCLVAVIDWYSRFVVSWALDQTLAVGFVLQAVDQALLLAIPEFLNSDQGSQFTNPHYIDRPEAKHVQVSMDGRGRALDNVITERHKRSVMYEEVYLQNYQTPREARIGLRHYFPLYNYQRPHQALDYRTPAEVYFAAQNQVQLIPSETEVSTLI